MAGFRRTCRAARNSPASISVFYPAAKLHVTKRIRYTDKGPHDITLREVITAADALQTAHEHLRCMSPLGLQWSSASDA
jgi:hypothetical protein